MRGRLSMVISDVREMELRGGAGADCPSLGSLMARIARRPGRWRARMAGPASRRGEPGDEGFDRPLPEAA